MTQSVERRAVQDKPADRAVPDSGISGPWGMLQKDHSEREEGPPMPAITPENVLALPVVAPPDPSHAAARPVVSVTTAPTGTEGLGFPVHRAFAGVAPALLDPFVHMDEMGAVEYGPGEPTGTPWHPHRGFETVTYMIDGVMRHQDSAGGGGRITDGDTQWMTAGAGILHIETPPEELVVTGGLFHGIQLWVNLPAAQKMTPPRYQDIRAEQVALVRSADGGALLRIIAGAVAGHVGPGSTHTPIAVVHATVAPGAELTVPWAPDFNALVYVLDGHGTLGPERRPIHSGQLGVLGTGDVVTFRADEPGGDTAPVELLLLGGRPIREPIAWYGPFVMNTQDELAQAFEDFQAGRLGTIPAGA
jgi:redox-sensitive bicupin YhaK (pirin superfamily)